MAASLPSDVNDKIKKKLLALSENVRRNLLLAAGDVQRKFILEERDLLSILVLAIQYLQKPSSSSSSSSSSTPPPTIERKPQQQQQQTPSTTTTNTTTTDDDNMGKSGGKMNNLDTSEKLRKELLKILDSTSFDSDAKSWLLLDAHNRYSNYNTLTKEQEILDKHLKRHPNVLVGGGESNVNESNDEVTDNAITDNSSDNGENSTPQTKKQTNSKPTTTASLETAPTNCQIVTNTKQNNTPIRIWINDALKTITSYMKNRINVIFLENLQNHAGRLQNFLSSKGTFDKDNNRVIAPHNRFFLKKDSLYFKIKAVKGLQNFDLATLLACVSFSKSKLFRFLQYRFKKVRAFTRNEKQCIHIFLNTCPISKRRIPCGAIRNLANA